MVLNKISIYDKEGEGLDQDTNIKINPLTRLEMARRLPCYVVFFLKMYPYHQKFFLNLEQMYLRLEAVKERIFSL